MVMKRVFLLLLLAACTITMHAQTQDERLFQQAETRFQNGEYSSALNLYNEILTDFKYFQYSADVQYRKAVCLYRLGKTEEAYILFGKVENKYRSSRFILYVPFWKGVISYSNSSYSDCITEINSFIENDTGDYTTEAYQYLAMAFSKSGNKEKAAASLEFLFQLDNELTAIDYPLVLLSSLYLQSRLYDKCITLLKDSISEKVSASWKPQIDLYLAEAYWGKGDKALTEALYKNLLNEDVEIVSVAMSRLFTIYQEAGRQEELDEILLSAEKKLAQRPDILSEFWLRIGISVYKEGKLQLSESYFQRAWSIGNFEKMSGLVPLYYSELQFDNEKPAKALSIIDSFTAESADNAELLYYRKIIYYWELRDYKTLEKRLSEFTVMFPAGKKFAEASYLYAYVLFFLGKIDDSMNVVTRINQQAAGAEYGIPFLRLKSVLQQRQGKFSEAIQSLRKYTPLSPKDVPARVDLIKLYFQSGDITSVLIETESLYSDFPQLKSGYFKHYILTSYLRGLAYIQKGSNSAALDSFDRISEESLVKSGYEALIPYYLYYNGWVLYRTGNYNKAKLIFGELSGRKNNPFPNKAIYLAGWCSFLDNDFSNAERYFSIAADRGAEGERSRFMYGKSLAAQKKYDAAVNVFKKMGDSDSSFADDALFEQSSLFVKMDKIDESAQVLKQIYSRFPKSSFAEESMFKRGQVFYENKRYSEARSAYRDYRVAYPNGSFVDSALYWGGVSAYSNSESFSAIILWKKILNEYSNSEFRSEVMYKTADLYHENGELDKARDLYKQLLIEFPEVAKAVKAENELQKILYIQLGQSEREEELSLVIKKEGSASKKGREAMIALSWIYLINRNDSNNIISAIKMLEQVIEKGKNDPVSASDANYTLGNYYSTIGQYEKAEEYFYASLKIAENNSDLAARAVFRIAEVSVLTGNEKAAESAVNQQEIKYGTLDWVDEARKVLGVK